MYPTSCAEIMCSKQGIKIATTCNRVSYNEHIFHKFENTGAIKTFVISWKNSELKSPDETKKTRSTPKTNQCTD